MVYFLNYDMFYTIIQVFKPFRLLRVVEALSPGNDAVLEQMARAMAYFISTLFLASGMVQVSGTRVMRVTVERRG